MPDKVKLTFNGREVETEAGKPLIKLSHELGQVIPHPCVTLLLSPLSSLLWLVLPLCDWTMLLL